MDQKPTTDILKRFAGRQAPWAVVASAARSRQVEEALAEFTIDEIRDLVEELELELGR